MLLKAQTPCPIIGWGGCSQSDEVPFLSCLIALGFFFFFFFNREKAHLTSKSIETFNYVTFFYKIKDWKNKDDINLSNQLDGLYLHYSFFLFLVSNLHINKNIFWLFWKIFKVVNLLINFIGNYFKVMVKGNTGYTCASVFFFSRLVLGPIYELHHFQIHQGKPVKLVIFCQFTIQIFKYNLFSKLVNYYNVIPMNYFFIKLVMKISYMPHVKTGEFHFQ